MSSNFQKCPNGHYYDSSLSKCPYCPSTVSPGVPTQRTGPYPGEYEDDGKTKPYFEGAMDSTVASPYSDGLQKTLVEGQPVAPPKPASPMDGNKTQFFDENVEGVKEGKRAYRKLVGWLVSYTIDKCGVDFKLYEGRNIIGRDGDCQIVIPDGTVTGKHAVILYRNGKYSITDQQSSNGTYVNGEDIELEPKYINDGDIIKIGDTELTFRTSF